MNSFWDFNIKFLQYYVYCIKVINYWYIKGKKQSDFTIHNEFNIDYTPAILSYYIK